MRLVLVLSLGFALMASLAGAAELPDDSVSYWLPYQPGKNTLALYAFDGASPLADLAGKSAALTLPAGVVVAPEGRFGGGLAFRAGHGPLTITLGESLFAQGRFIIDFWVKAEALPPAGGSVSLLHKPQEPGKANGFDLTLNADGSLVWAHRTLSSTAVGKNPTHPEWFVELKSAPGAIRVGQWQHVAIHVGTFSHVFGSDLAWLMVDGVKIGTSPNGWCYIDYTAKEGGPSAFVMGGGVTGAVAFVGSVDQFRVVSGVFRRFYPAPDESWLDLEKKRPLAGDPACVAGGDDILFKAEFEDSLVATTARGNAKPVRVIGQPTYEPGVRGKALHTVPGWMPLQYATVGNLNIPMGAMELWVKPLNWQLLGSKMTGFFHVDRGHILWIPNDGFSMQLSGGIENFDVDYIPDTWMHLVFVWADRYVAGYVNGECKLKGLMPTPFSQSLTNAMMGFGWGKEMLIDEATLYRRPLSAAEVRNHYARYFPKRTLTPLPPMDNITTFLQGVGKVSGTAYPRHSAPSGVTTARVAMVHGAQRLAETVVPYSADAGATFLLQGLPYPLPPAEYRLLVDLLDVGGKVVGGAPAPFVFKRYPWLGNECGVDNRVLKPWTPIQVKRDAITVVGRRYDLGDNGLFDQISSQGQSLLAAPMAIEISGGGTTSIVTSGSAKIIAKAPHEVRWRGTMRAKLAGQRLDIGVEGLMEYDGHAVLTLRLAPPPGQTVKVDRLALVLPLKSDWVQQYLMIFGIGVPSGTGVAPNQGAFTPGSVGPLFSSKVWYEFVGWEGTMQHTGIFDYHQAVSVDEKKAKLQKRWKPTLGNFIPQLWIGNDTLGLAYMGDSDAGWVPTDAAPAVALEGRGGVVDWRFNFISEPFELTAPRTIVLSFQATPEKPQPPNWRQHFWRGPADKDRGITAVWLSDGAGWDEEGVGPYPYNYAASKAATDSQRALGRKVTPHLDTSAMNWGHVTVGEFAAEWDSGGFQYNQIFTRSRIDFSAWSLWRWKQKYGIDGVYFDTGTPLPNLNTLSGTAYALPDGRVQPAWTMFGQREYYKRAAHIFGDIGTEGFNWSCGYTGPQIAGWQWASVPGGEYRIDYAMDRYPGPFDFMRTLSNGGHFGTLMMWMGLSDYVKRAEAPENYIKFMRHMYAMMLPLDAKWCFGGFNYPTSFYEFGYADADVRFVGFWDNPYVKCEPASGLYPSLYLKPGGRSLFIISNLGDEPVKLKLRLDAKAMGLDPKKAVILDGDRFELTPKPNEDAFEWSRRVNRGGVARMPGGDEGLRKIGVVPEGDAIRVDLLVPPRDYRSLDVFPQSAK